MSKVIHWGQSPLHGIVHYALGTVAVKGYAADYKSLVKLEKWRIYGIQDRTIPGI